MAKEKSKAPNNDLTPMAKEVEQFNGLRSCCLQNAAQLLESAQHLVERNVNHIAYHLAVLSLEEVGKIFVVWLNVNRTEMWGKDTASVVKLDDHIKKLFWVIWWPIVLKEKVTNKQIEDIRQVATAIHNKRLDTLYVQIGDLDCGSDKITDQELIHYIGLAKDRLTYASEYQFTNQLVSREKDSALAWLDTACDDPFKRVFIFSDESFEKFEHFGNSKNWIAWLQDKFSAEEKRMRELLNQELTKPLELKNNPTRKWRIRFTVNTPSHSIRNSVLSEFNKSDSVIQLHKGKGVHSLVVDLFLNSNTPVQGLWQDGFLNAQLFVAALNVGTNGIFYWNTTIDTAKFYDTTWDLENGLQVQAVTNPDLRFDWSAMKLFLEKINLILASKMFYYFASSLLDKTLFEPINWYLVALGQSSKIDVHLRIEKQCFYYFFIAFRMALQRNEGLSEDFDMTVVAVKQIGGILDDHEQLRSKIALGMQLLQDFNSPLKVTLTEVFAMKLYCNYYFVTLALRKIENRKDIFLTRNSFPSSPS